MRQCRLLLAPALGTLVLAACTSPTYTYGPASYATPPSTSPYQPVEIPLPRPSVSATPLGAPGAGVGSSGPGPLDAPLDPLPSGPGPSGTDPLNPPSLPPLDPLPGSPPPADPPAQVDPAPAAAPPSDPVTDLLLAPPSEQRDAPSAVVKKPSPPEANPLMGFRPMRGQTAPTP